MNEDLFEAIDDYLEAKIDSRIDFALGRDTLYSSIEEMDRRKELLKLLEKKKQF